MTDNHMHQDLDGGISVIDMGYHRPGCAASYLMVEQGRGAFVEAGTSRGVPRLLAELARRGLSPEAVDYLIVTHVHLDHAGGAGTLLRHLPNAKLVVHPSGAPHLINPEKLVAGTRAVYGDDAFERYHEEVAPVPEERVLAVADDDTIELAGRPLLLLDTPGHARHHLCVWDQASQGMFTGDTCGISYREFDVGGQAFLFPATTPTQFDPQAFHKSIDRLATYQPRWLYLTHFGPLAFNRWLVDDLHRQIDRTKALALGMRRAGEERHQRLVGGLERIYFSRLKRMHCPLSRDRVLELLAMDIELNALGLEAWLDRSQKSGPGGGRPPGARPLPRFVGP